MEENRLSLQTWLADLSHLSHVWRPRCYKQATPGPVSEVQLHHFSNASECSYGTVSYTRTIHENGQESVSFIRGKARLAPSKQQTISRLELSAAVRATETDEQLRRDLNIPIAKSVF